jgi:lycopene beta-cyclase
MSKNAKEFQQFFGGFFELDPNIWCSFLAGWKYLPGYENHNTWWARLLFGLTALTKLPVSIGASMAVSIVSYCLVQTNNNNGIDLIQSVTPLAGEPERHDSSLEFRGKENQGDIAAKQEAMEMLLCNCDRCEEAIIAEEEDSEIR